ncbi:fibronectin type III domain-containing protein [Dehalococcoides mccartyi]|uniref:Conserved domain protein n=1 Tax=Dehalococcoides mccartyi (strain CBDB1) TaxID=255470 RepID=A0A916NZY3_DEHMC|nr:fibronectin type III domain-containing protein [Dehalococcoides mccartyi]CAI83414.1 conserved domain protein [Dehalococcoides mccartyi CBDB1]
MFKTKISKVLGVVLTAAMVLSMFAVATPVAAANQDWSKVSLPGSGATGGYVVSAPGARFDNIGILEWNADKTAVYATAEYDGVASVFKSTDAGRTWKMLTIPTVTGNIIYDFVASSVNANELYFTDGREIFTSKDGGATWNNLSNVFTWAVANTWTTPPVSGTNLIVTLDIGYAGANKYVFAGTAQFGTVGTGNGVFMCQETAFGMPWSDLAIDTQRATPWAAGCSVWDVVVDPTDFAVRQGVMAVATAAGNTVITAKYFGNQWNQTATCDDTQVLMDNTTPITDVVHAELWLPSDFSSSLTSGKFQAWLAIQTLGGHGDVYLWYGSANSATTPKTIDLNVRGIGTETEVTDIDGIGGVADAKLIIGGYDIAVDDIPMVLNSSDRLTFSANSKRPTGADSTWGLSVATVTVLAMADYNTSGKALAGTAGLDCGVSYTADFGKTWNTISMMRQLINSVENIAGSLFVVTNDFYHQSVWRIVNGVTERVFSSSLIGGPFNQLDVQVSPAGDAVFIADLGGVNIWRSLDNGQIFTKQISDIIAAGGSIINSWFVSNANTVLVGGSDVVYQTSTNGVLWFARPCVIGTITSFAVSTDGSVLVAAGSDSTISKSVDGGVTWSTATAPTTVTSSVPVVTFQNGSNSVVYLTGDSGHVYKYDFAATTPAWKELGTATPVTDFDWAATSAVVNGVGIFSGIASGGSVLYVLDANAVADGLSRFTMVGTTSYAGSVATPGTAVGTKLIGIAAPGANMLYGIFGAELYVYTDKMAVPVANVQITKITTTSLTVTWDALNVDNSNIEVMYYVYITDAATGAKVAYMTTSAFTSDGTTVGTSFKINDLDVDTVYQVSVWAVDPVMSFVGTASVSTQPDRPDYTVNLMPTNGAINIPIKPVFAWDSVATAVSYDLILSTDPTFADATKVLATKSLTTNYWAYDGTLTNSTSYYWRVRINTANSTSEWFPAVFTTVKADAAPVEVNNPPAITLTVPQAETPAYIWLIVAVGAVLTVAVIVLIVRTRRVV